MTETWGGRPAAGANNACQRPESIILMGMVPSTDRSDKAMHDTTDLLGLQSLRGQFFLCIFD